MQSVEGMKLVCYELMDAANRPAGADGLRIYATSANDLVIELTSKIEKASQGDIKFCSGCNVVRCLQFGPNTSLLFAQVFRTACMQNNDEHQAIGNQRSCKYTLNALLQVGLHTSLPHRIDWPLLICVSRVLRNLHRRTRKW